MSFCFRTAPDNKVRCTSTTGYSTAELCGPGDARDLQVLCYHSTNIFSPIFLFILLKALDHLPSNSSGLQTKHNGIRVDQPTGVNSAKPAALHNIALWLPYPPLAAHTEQALVSSRPYTLC